MKTLVCLKEKEFTYHYKKWSVTHMQKLYKILEDTENNVDFCHLKMTMIKKL